jgi:hypothetical protein
MSKPEEGQLDASLNADLRCTVCLQDIRQSAASTTFAGVNTQGGLAEK